MSKERPNDIPQDVWDAVSVGDIAMAILAERERCALIAEAYVQPAQIWERDEIIVVKLSTNYAVASIAAAIRKGGE